MKFIAASILALATAAIASPTNHPSNQCAHYVCTDSNLLVLDVDVDVKLLGLLDLDLGLDVLLGHSRKCKKVYCCPTPCQKVRYASE